MTHVNRPDQITTILEAIGQHYPADVVNPLGSYIADLESRQQAFVSADELAPSADSDTPPIWSYQRVLKREQNRRERAARELHLYR